MSTPLNLGYLTSVYARASDTFIRNEVLELRRRGHTVRTYSIRTPEDEQQVSEEIKAERARTLYILPDHARAAFLAVPRLFLTQPARTLAALALSWRTGAKGLRARLLHAAYFVEACFLATRLRADGVRHLHVHLEEQPATVGMLAAALAGLPYSMAVHGPYIFRAPVAWALGEKIARAAFVTCISEFTRSQCMLYAKLEHWPKLHLVRCAPHPSFLAAEPAPFEARRRFVWVGRVCEEKGVPILVEAAAALAKEGHEFELELLGDGPLLPMVRARIAREGLERRVRTLGWASSDLVRARLSTATALVQPSFAEGLPVVIMEALALGRPVISTYVAGIPELVEPGVDGWLVPAGSVEALAAAMRRAIEAPTAELIRLGLGGRARVSAQHNIALEVTKLVALLQASSEVPASPDARDSRASGSRSKPSAAA
jgi:glycosyltransferase involved in cell wall biosynthesis